LLEMNQKKVIEIGSSSGESEPEMANGSNNLGVAEESSLGEAINKNNSLTKQKLLP
jgi:hypothetical protein